MSSSDFVDLGPPLTPAKKSASSTSVDSWEVLPTSSTSSHAPETDVLDHKWMEFEQDMIDLNNEPEGTDQMIFDSQGHNSDSDLLSDSESSADEVSLDEMLDVLLPETGAGSNSLSSIPSLSAESLFEDLQIPASDSGHVSEQENEICNINTREDVVFSEPSAQPTPCESSPVPSSSLAQKQPQEEARQPALNSKNEYFQSTSYLAAIVVLFFFSPLLLAAIDVSSSPRPGTYIALRGEHNITTTSSDLRSAIQATVPVELHDQDSVYYMLPGPPKPMCHNDPCHRENSALQVRPANEIQIKTIGQLDTVRENIFNPHFLGAFSRLLRQPETDIPQPRFIPTFTAESDTPETSPLYSSEFDLFHSSDFIQRLLLSYRNLEREMLDIDEPRSEDNPHHDDHGSEETLPDKIGRILEQAAESFDSDILRSVKDEATFLLKRLQRHRELQAEARNKAREELKVFMTNALAETSRLAQDVTDNLQQALRQTVDVTNWEVISGKIDSFQAWLSGH